MEQLSGVYYRREDYAPFWLRLSVDFVDSIAIVILSLIALLALSWLVPGRLLFFVLAAIFFGYFVLLKRTNGGTLGYRFFRVRIVGLDGGRPGIFALLVRLSFMMLGPLNYILDVVWLTDDPHRQALRDKFSETYVIRKRAVPAGSAKLVHRYYEIIYYNFLFREVEVGPTVRV